MTDPHASPARPLLPIPAGPPPATDPATSTPPETSSGFRTAENGGGGSPPAAAKKAPPNKLDRARQRVLEDWLAQRWPDIERARYTQLRAAKAATACLGFRCTRGNLLGAAKALGLTWPTNTRDAYALHRLRQADATIARALVDLLRDLGRDVPLDLAGLLAERSPAPAAPEAQLQHAAAATAALGRAVDEVRRDQAPTIPSEAPTQ